MSTALVLFRRDLRLQDNPALAAACAAHGHVLPVYIHAPDEEGAWAIGAASQWWLHHSLASLQKRLHSHHAGLHIAQGDSLTCLQALIKQSGADAVYWNRLYEPATIERDTQIKTALPGRSPPSKGIRIGSSRRTGAICARRSARPNRCPNPRYEAGRRWPAALILKR
jgi:deoxyribodipyrimidine photolyase